MTRPRNSTRELVKVLRNYGMHTREARTAVMAVTRAIEDMLREGRDVNLNKIGSFRWRFRRGRRMKNNFGTANTPDRHVPHFKISDKLKSKLKGVVAKHPQRPVNRKRPVNYSAINAAPQDMKQ